MSAVPLSPPPPAPLRRLQSSSQSALARGESQLWLCGGALVVSLVLIAGLMLLVLARGLGTFWPEPLVEVRLLDGTRLLGELTRREHYRPGADVVAALDEPVRAAAHARLQDRGGTSERELLRTGNFELTGGHFSWVPDFLVAERTLPAWGLVLERTARGRFYGTPVAYRLDGHDVATGPAAAMAAFAREHAEVRERVRRQQHLRQTEFAQLGARQEDARLAVRAAELRQGADSAACRAAAATYAQVCAECQTAGAAILHTIDELGRDNARHQLVVRTADGREQLLPVADIVRACTPNQLGLWGCLAIYLERWAEFLLDEPREANSEGGVWPAIVGTVLMTLLMSLCVVPFGVLAALWLREYARAGLLISAVRIAVNNLAGVPSIVFGVFGLGFFCYLVGGTVDALCCPERLPSPTFGKGALLWASLTLALLTLPVVIVATEEALAAVPGSMREGSYACGASKWQTIARIVLPRALPGIMTGVILAMARGAGEVAPLMLVGAVKLAPQLPLDATAPFLHPSRSFMHLGFHIFDLGFQSENSEAAKPMVFTTTLLLIAVITALNLAAVWLRNRLRRSYAGAHF